MANAWQQVDQIASEALIHMEDSLVITAMCAKDKSADFNKTPDGYAVGDSVRIKTRPDFEAKEFAGSTITQEIRESKRQMTIEKHFDVTVQMTAKEKALSLESLVEQVINPAVARIAEKCDIYVGTKILEGAGLYASDDLFASSADMALARKAANYQQLDPGSRFCLVNDTLEAKLLGASYFNTHNNRGETGSKVFSSGSMGPAMGMQFHASLNFPESTISSGDGAGVTENDATGTDVNKVGTSTLYIDAATGTFNAGDRIQIAGVRRPLIVASQTVVGETPTDDSIPLVDPITEIIPDNAAVTIIASDTASQELQGAIFDGQSLAVAMPILDSPSDKPSFVVSHSGYSIRVVQGYDMTTKQDILSLDCLIGAKAWDPRRITLLRNY